jgi:transcriptional regulator with XRE-family HTH domain
MSDPARLDHGFDQSVCQTRRHGMLGRMTPLHESLVSRRKAKELSQERLAEEAGVPRSQLHLLETGKNVTLATLNKVAGRLGMVVMEVPEEIAETVDALAGKVIAISAVAASDPAGATRYRGEGRLPENVMQTIRQIERRKGRERKDS